MFNLLNPLFLSFVGDISYDLLPKRRDGPAKCYNRDQSKPHSQKARNKTKSLLSYVSSLKGHSERIILLQIKPWKNKRLKKGPDPQIM